MNKSVVILLAVLLVIGGALLLWPSDKKKIRTRLASLAEYCSSEPGEPVLKTLQKAAFAAKLCSNPCSVTFTSLNIDRKFTPKELTDHLLMMKKRLPDTDFSFHDTDIALISATRAVITTTLRLNGKSVNGEFTDAYEINISSEKITEDWRFSSFLVVEFLKK